MITINNQRKRTPRRGGTWLVALFFVGVLAVSCTRHPAQTALASVLGAPAPTSPSATASHNNTGDSSTIDSADPSAFSLYQAGLRSINKKDWLSAENFLDQAIDDLVNSTDDSTVTQDSVAQQALTIDILRALERVYPQLSELGKVAPDLADMADNVEPEDLENIDDSLDNSPLDSASITWLAKKMDTLNLKQFSLPVEVNERVLREVSFLTQSVPEFTASSLSRKKNFDAMISAKLKARGMPADLIYLAFIESGFKTKAYSRAKASGLWQFIPGTGKRYGLPVDFWVDMRRNSDAATDAALDYLKDLHDEFGDWLLAMAAYNCGEGRIRKLVKDSTNYWNLKLPRETMHYVPRILAAMLIGHNPSLYNFHVEDPDPLLSFDTITVKECVPLQSLAEAAGTSLNVMKDLNPELNRWCTPPNSKGYLLRIPQGSYDQFTDAYAKMDKAKFSKWYQHKVRSGENLGKIARAFGLSISALKQVNGLKNNHLRVGQVILIPMPQGAIPPSAEKMAEATGAPTKNEHTNGQYKVHKGDKLAGIARRFGVSKADLKSWNNLTSDKIFVGKMLQVDAPHKTAEHEELTSIKAGTATYTVKAGDNFYSISQAFKVSMDELMQLNKANGEAKLALGQVLKLPASVKSTDEQPAESRSSNGKATKKDFGGLDWHVVKNGDNLASISRHYQVSLADLLRWNNLDAKAVVKAGQKLRVRPLVTASTGVFHTVRKGDTLWDIAHRYGVSVQQILDWNSIRDGKVKTGTRLKVGA